MVRHLQAGNLRAALDLMPHRIEDAAKGTPISVVTKAIDPLKVEAFIAFALNKEVAQMWNGDARLNLQSHQMPTIAKNLMETYRNESLADFTVCFRRGIMGMYGEIYRIDLSVLNGWMTKYMEEKYRIIEDNLAREKDEYFKPVVPENSDRDWLGEWQKAIETGAGVQGVPQLTPEEIAKEGQEKPVRDVYPFILSEAEVKLREVKQTVAKCQELTVRERHPEWTESQVQERLKELSKSL